MWNKGLNQTRVEASFTLRKAESVYYPPAICAPASASSKTDITSEVAELEKDSSDMVPLSSGSPSKEAEQLGVVVKEVDTIKGVAPDDTKPLTVPQDPLKEKEVPPKMEIILATLPMPAKGDLKGKDQGSSEAALSQSSKASPKDKIVIKKK